MNINDLSENGDSLDLGFLEFNLLAPINALFFSSLVYAAERDMGIQISNGVLHCDFPHEVSDLLGLELINDGALLSQEPYHLLRLTPLSEEKLKGSPSNHYHLWQRVFSTQMPDAVISIDADYTQDKLYWGINDSWLVWDWKISTLEHIALSKKATERLDIIHSDPDWFTFSKQAVHEHPRFLAEQFVKRGAMPAQLIEELDRYNKAV
jgi:hypothetical protein